MSSERNEPPAVSANQREFEERLAAEEDVIVEFDVNSLIGSTAIQPELTDDERSELGWEVTRRGVGKWSNPNDMYQNSYYFDDDDQVHWEHTDLVGVEPPYNRYEVGAQRLIGALASRQGPEIVDHLKDAVFNLKEPVRIVAVNHFYMGHDQASIAKRLGTSVEAVDFLAEMALDQLQYTIKIVKRD